MTERRFANHWAELDYLCKKDRTWLHTRQKRLYARRYLDRLRPVFEGIAQEIHAILREEGYALLCELKSCNYREISVMSRLLKDAESPGMLQALKTYMLKDRDENAIIESCTHSRTSKPDITANSDGPDKRIKNAQCALPRTKHHTCGKCDSTISLGRTERTGQRVTMTLLPLLNEALTRGELKLDRVNGKRRAASPACRREGPLLCIHKFMMEHRF